MGRRKFRRQKFRRRKFRRDSKSRNFIVRNIVVGNFVVLIRINSIHQKKPFQLFNYLPVLTTHGNPPLAIGEPPVTTSGGHFG